MQVATRLFHFRWVQWNERALGDGPLYTPGRFLAPRDDFLSHLYEDAAPGSAWHDHAAAKVPDYSSDEACAFRAAEQAALFSAGRAVLCQDDGGRWIVQVAGQRYMSPRLPEVICRASLEWTGTASAAMR